MNRPRFFMRYAGHFITACAILFPAIWFGYRLFSLGNWVIDDAGISMAYGKHLLEGHGLVAQPGVPPTEGYSNPLWVLLMLPFQLLPGFAPTFHPKILAGILVLATGFLPWAFFRHLRAWPLAMVPSGIMLAFCAPLGIWCASGLENPLYLFLVLALAVSSTCHRHGAWDMIRTGFLIFLVGITRPEGIIYALPAFLAIWLRLRESEGHWVTASIGRRLATLIFAAAIPGLAFICWRYAYFHAWLPNTYIAKSGEKGIGLLLEPNQHRILLESVAGYPAWITGGVILGIALAALLAAWLQRRQTMAPFILVASTLLFLFTGYLNYILLPQDWMPEFRFATPFFGFLAMLPVLLLISLPRNLARMAILPILGLVALFARNHETRFREFSEAPTVPLCLVRYLMVERYETAAKRLDIEQFSLLTPDCGATYYFAGYPVYDLAGLCDRRYARYTLGKDPASLAGLVFDTDKPVFIDLSPNWSCSVRLHDDFRLARDYFPIVQDSTDACGSMYPFGVYVRKDVLDQDSSRLEKLGNLFRQGPVYRLPVWRSCGCTAKPRQHTVRPYSGRSQ